MKNSLSTVVIAIALTSTTLLVIAQPATYTVKPSHEKVEAQKENIKAHEEKG